MNFFKSIFFLFFALAAHANSLNATAAPVAAAEKAADDKAEPSFIEEILGGTFFDSMLKKEKKRDAVLKTQAHALTKLLPGQGGFSLSSANPFVSSEIDRKKYSDYKNALYAYIFCSEQMFFDECEKLSKKDKETALHYKKIFDSFFAGLKHVDDIDLASSTPTFIKSNLLKKSIEKVIDFLENPDFDETKLFHFIDTTPDQLMLIMLNMLTNSLPESLFGDLSLDDLPLEINESVLAFALEGVDNPAERNKLTGIYTQNKAALFIDVFLKKLDKDERFQLAQVLKRFDIGKLFSCQSATEVKELLEEIRVKSPYDEFHLMELGSHALSTLASIFIGQFLPEDESLDILNNFFANSKNHFKARVKACKEASKAPWTDKASFDQQSMITAFEAFTFEDLPKICVEEVDHIFSDMPDKIPFLTEIKGMKFSIDTWKNKILLLCSRLSPENFEKVLDALIDHNKKGTLDLVAFVFVVKPYVHDIDVLLESDAAVKIDLNDLTTKGRLAAQEKIAFKKFKAMLQEQAREKVREHTAKLPPEKALEAAKNTERYINSLFPLLCPEGTLISFLSDEDAELTDFIKNQIKNAFVNVVQLVSKPFKTLIFNSLKEYSWRKENYKFIYEEYNELTSSLNAENNLPNYIDLFFELKNGRWTNPELVARYDAYKWNSRLDLEIVLKEINGIALTETEQNHKNHFLMLSTPSPAKNSYGKYRKKLRAFIEKSNPQITSPEEYDEFIKKIEANRFISCLYKKEAELAELEKEWRSNRLQLEHQELHAEFTDEQRALFFGALEKEDATRTNEEKELIEWHLKHFPQLTESQEVAINALDELKAFTLTASTAEHEYILFINNRELLLKQKHNITLSSQELAKIRTFNGDKETPWYKNSTFLKKYNNEHPKITKAEIFHREQCNIIKKELYKHTVDLLHYRLDQAKITDFFEDPLFVGASLFFKKFHTSESTINQVPSDLFFLKNMISSTYDSLEKELQTLLITNITTPELKAARDSYIESATEGINFKALAEAYQKDLDAGTLEEQMAIAEATFLVAAQESIAGALGFASLVKPSSTGSVRNSSMLYKQLPYVETFVNLIDSTPIAALDAFVLGGTLQPYKDLLFNGLNTLSDTYFPERPETTTLKEFIDTRLNPDQDSPVKQEVKLKSVKEMTDEMQREIREKMINDDLESIKSEQKAKEQNNRLLVEIPITDDLSFGITPHDIRSLSYDVGSTVLATKIDHLLESTKSKILKETLLSDPLLLPLLKNIDTETREQLVAYADQAKSDGVPASIRDDRPKQSFTSPIQMIKEKITSFTSSKSKKKTTDKKTDFDLKKPKYTPSALNKLRMHLEGSEKNDGLLTPLINNPKSFSLWKNIGIKTAFTYLVGRLKEAAVGQKTFLRTYENIGGTLHPKNDKVVVTPSTIDPIVVTGAVLAPELCKEGIKFYNESAEALKYAPKIFVNAEKQTGIPLFGNLFSSLPETMKTVMTTFFIPDEARIIHSEDFIFSEYPSATLLSIFGTFFEYLLYDKVSSRKLSLYFQQNIHELESLLKAYQKAKKHKDNYAMKQAEKKFEKFISKSKVAFTDRSLIIKLLPKLFLLFNLVPRLVRYLLANNFIGKHFVDANPQESFFLNILSRVLDMNSEQIDSTYKIMMTGTIGAIGYSLFKSLKMIENNYYN